MRPLGEAPESQSLVQVGELQDRVAVVVEQQQAEQPV
jgi:hypothetical protein